MDSERERASAEPNGTYTPTIFRVTDRKLQSQGTVRAVKSTNPLCKKTRRQTDMNKFFLYTTQKIVQNTNPGPPLCLIYRDPTALRTLNFFRYNSSNEAATATAASRRRQGGLWAINVGRYTYDESPCLPLPLHHFPPPSSSPPTTLPPFTSPPPSFTTARANLIYLRVAANIGASL